MRKERLGTLAGSGVGGQIREGWGQLPCPGVPPAHCHPSLMTHIAAHVVQNVLQLTSAVRYTSQGSPAGERLPLLWGICSALHSGPPHPGTRHPGRSVFSSIPGMHPRVVHLLCSPKSATPQRAPGSRPRCSKCRPAFSAVFLSVILVTCSHPCSKNIKWKVPGVNTV